MPTLTRTDATVDLDPSWTADGDQKGDLFGGAVTGAGDVNGDGYDDLLVGAPRYSLDLYRDGAVFLFFGTASRPETNPAWTAGGGQKGAEFGSAVAAAGDVNGDGYADVLVGAPRYNSDTTFQPEEGAVYLFYGGDHGLQTAPAWQYISDKAYAHLGAAVAGAGDVNGDGYDDLLVGADLYPNDGDESQGRVFLFFGSNDGPADEPDWTLENHQVGARFGAYVGSAGDVNGDGYSDLWAGAPYFDADEPEAGAVFFFHGSAAGPGDIPNGWAACDQADCHLGAAAGLGDVDGDGFDDLLVGAPEYDNGLFGEGAAFWFQGSSAGLQPTGWKAFIPQTGSLFGSQVAGPGDVNGDGYADAVVGASEYSDDHLNEGGLFVFYGGQDGLSSTPKWQATGEKADTDFAISTAAAGDVNGDGFADIISGAPVYFLTTEPMGRAFLFLGLPDDELPDPYFYLHLPVLVHR